MGVAVGVVGGSISIASTVATGVALVAVACIVSSVCYNKVGLASGVISLLFRKELPGHGHWLVECTQPRHRGP